MKPSCAPPSSCRGIALIMVLMVVAVLTGMAGIFAYNMKVEVKLARNASFETELEWLGRSGVEVGKFILGLRTGQSAAAGYDALNQAWAGGIGETNEIALEWLGRWVPLGEGEFKVEIEDMDRRLNINSCNIPSPEGEAILRQAMVLVGIDASLTPTVVNSILDWMDVDKNSRPGGAETDFYQSLTPPGRAKNAPIDDITELLLINGVRDEPAMYWGSGGPPARRQPRSARQSQFEERVYDTGLRDLFCAVSSGRINVNTAKPMVLQLIPGVDELKAQELVDYRSGLDHIEGTEDDVPFKSDAEIAAFLGRGVPIQSPFMRFLGVRSRVFQIRVFTRIGTVKRTYVAYVQRGLGFGGQNFSTLNLLWEDQ
ncbi:MAG: general secretion pathway protein GspK [Verrucomicrobia bacterium]|nr:general secretion pathway protein GspK [Verrucomicrobiota bacterium]